MQVSTAPPAEVRARVTELLAAVRLLFASWMATTGWVANAVPPVELEGLVVKTILEAAPALMVKLLLAALVSPLAAAVRV